MYLAAYKKNNWLAAVTNSSLMFGLARELSYKTAEGSRYTRKILLPRCKKDSLDLKVNLVLAAQPNICSTQPIVVCLDID
jgi:hypothetical protein